MVISNKYRIKFKMQLLILLSISNIVFTIGLYIFIPLINNVIIGVLLFISLSLFLIIARCFANLKVFHFENKGILFCIKYYHPLKKGPIPPVIQYPLTIVQYIDIKNSPLFSNPVIDITLATKENPLYFRFKACGFSDQYIRVIKNSFPHLHQNIFPNDKNIHANKNSDLFHLLTNYENHL